jgi:hypothetical protein
MIPVDIQSTWGLVLALVFGAAFGVLLHKGGVTEYNVIVNQFRLKDFTVVKIMLTAVVVGGIGVALLNVMGLAQYHIKPMLAVGVVLGAVLFGIGMVIYGYCPGTGVCAVARGSLHALAGFAGMLLGGVAYAFSYPWVKAQLLGIGDSGAIRLPAITGIPGGVLLGVLTIGAVGLFVLLGKNGK